MTDKEFKRRLRQSLPPRNKTVEELFRFVFLILIIAFLTIAYCKK